MINAQADLKQTLLASLDFEMVKNKIGAVSNEAQLRECAMMIDSHAFDGLSPNAREELLTLYAGAASRFMGLFG